MNNFNNLVIFEMANNHMGNIIHAYDMIDSYSKLTKEYKRNFKFAIKLQYRHLDTFIHPSMKKRRDIHYIKRFLETELSDNQMSKIVNYIRKKGFYAMATAFDEKSVKLIQKQRLDYIKVASCSYNDWPLLEEVVKLNIPTIISTAGAQQDELDKVVAFFNLRQKEFSIMHCVGEYPTQQNKLNLQRISLIKDRYKGLTVGYSSHENPDNYENVMIAYGSGARLFEKHIALPTKKYSKNLYSTDTNEIKNWLNSLNKAFVASNPKSKISSTNKKEIDTLYKLQRGVFLNKNVKKNEKITSKDVYFAFPAFQNQLTSNNFSKYLSITSKSSIKKNQPINSKNCKITNNQKSIFNIIKSVKKLISQSKINLPSNVSLEISHHYGLQSFNKFGLTMITIINRKYCKKILIMLPNQAHPEQFHKIKEETFIILYGSVILYLDGKKRRMNIGDTVTIRNGQRHFFKASNKGAIIEELSSTHIKSDSYYTDKKINQNPNRKTIVNYWV